MVFKTLNNVLNGSTTKAAIEAVNALSKQGISVRLVGMPTVFPIDEELIIESAAKTKGIVTVEEHYADGGLGTLISEFCSTNYPVRIKRLGIPKLYASNGPYEELLAYYGIDAAGIEKSVKEFLNI